MRHLAETFPEGGFVLREGGLAHPYRSIGRRLVHLGSNDVIAPETLDPAWVDLCRILLSDDYRQAMSTLIGRPLDDAGLQITVYRNGPGCRIPPHTDDFPLVVGQVFYFNQVWDPAWGGDLLILASPNAEDVVARISPTNTNSSILVRSDDSWHAVLPVADDVAAHEERTTRLSMTVRYYDHPETWRELYRASPMGSAYEDDRVSSKR